MLNEDDDRSLLSICVPTFNRSECLDILFRNIEKVKEMFGEQIEICVSNNQSTDRTAQVIENWHERLTLKVVTQETNIGGNKNIIEVTRLASGKWILIIGDDDELITENLGQLLDFLKSVSERDWILVDVTEQAGKKLSFHNIRPGKYDVKSFRKTLLRTGIAPLGFVGKHIFSSMLRAELLGLKREEFLFWPHIALFLRHLQGGQVLVFPVPIVAQAAKGSMLFWPVGLWVRACLSRIGVTAAAQRKIKRSGWFFYGLILRELYSRAQIIQLVRWKVLEPSEFHQKAFSQYIEYYRVLGPVLFLAIFHFISLLFVYCTPHFVFRGLLNMMGHDMISKYVIRKEMLSSFDVAKRKAECE
jgi:glycosyltransferase involved in cell wall biosynthesis